MPMVRRAAALLVGLLLLSSTSLGAWLGCAPLAAASAPSASTPGHQHGTHAQAASDSRRPEPAAPADSTRMPTDCVWMTVCAALALTTAPAGLALTPCIAVRLAAESVVAPDSAIRPVDPPPPKA